MAKAELKTKATGGDVSAFLAKVADDGRRTDCTRIVELMEDAVRAPARMWGAGIVGFGDTVLKYESGRELDWFVCGFAPRKDAIALYGLLKPGPATEKLLAKLGKHKTGKGCLYLKKLADVDVDVLRDLVKQVGSENKKKKK
jgi:hypothetical protein